MKKIGVIIGGKFEGREISANRRLRFGMGEAKRNPWNLTPIKIRWQYASAYLQEALS